MYADHCADADRDGLCDAAELELARRVAPVLKFPTREALLERMRTLWQVHDAGRGEVVISYVQAYVADIGAEHDGRVVADHPGDTEEVRYWLLSRDGGHTFKLVRARYWHHTSGQEWAAGEPGLETARIGEDEHPVVWVQRHAHGSYLDRATCSDDPEGDGDPCGDGFVARAGVDARANAGEAGAPLLDETGMAALGFAGESAWNERHNAFGVRGFCGGLEGTGVFGAVTHVGGDEVSYRRRVFAAVCAGPLAAQWDRKPRGTEDIIYWRGLRSQRVGPQRGRPAVGGDGRIHMRDERMGGDPAAAGDLLAYARKDGVVVVRTRDGGEHATPLRDPEVAMTFVGTRLYVAARGVLTFSDDGGRSFAPPQSAPMDTRERPALAAFRGKLLLAWRTPRRELQVRLLGEQSPRLVAQGIDHAPWATASEFDGGGVYVFTSQRGAIRYYKVGSDVAEPVEIPGAQVRSGGAVAALAGGRLLLAHDGAEGLYSRLFDPNIQ